MLRLKLIKKAGAGTLNQIISIYKEQGWWAPGDDRKRLRKFMAGSTLFLAALEGEKVVGMARIISDSVSDAYIQDLAVLKAFRGRGIGLKMVGFLLRELKKRDFRWIGLIAQGGAWPLYAKAGFKRMKNSRPMIYGRI